VAVLGGHRLGHARAGKLYEIDTVTMSSSILPTIFVAYDDTVLELVRERLGRTLALDDPSHLVGVDEPGGPRRGKVDCRPSFRMRQFDQMNGATWSADALVPLGQADSPGHTEGHPAIRRYPAPVAFASNA
jgi:hypothetical protein